MRLTAVLLAAAALFSIAIGRSAINSSEPTGVHVAAYWDPSVTVDDNACYKAIENGARLTCRLDANDEAAGRLWEDTRTPPSARSEWIDTQLTRDLNYWGWRESDWNQALVCDYSDDSNDHIHKIGSPLGSTLAFMLAQHKAELGHKHVTEVTVFRDNSPQDVIPSIQLLFTIKDVPSVSDSGASRIRRDGPKNIVRTHRFDALTGEVAGGGV